MKIIELADLTGQTIEGGIRNIYPFVSKCCDYGYNIFTIINQ
jgi:hypothetical protein